MNRLLFVTTLSCFTFISCEQPAPEVTRQSPAIQKALWSYEGDTGPQHWGKLDPTWRIASSGKKQSPIDLSSATSAPGLPILATNYKPTPLHLNNNGHTIVQTYAEGSSVSINGNLYGLEQFHFHHRSEHTVDGKDFPMECHLVHENAAGNLLVVGILIKEGSENEFLKNLWTELPAEADKSSTSILRINVEDLLPQDLSYYHYQGSLTTPPCTEGVQWYVLAEPVEASAAQIKAFAKIFPKNNRPVQNLFNRKILSNNG